MQDAWPYSAHLTPTPYPLILYGRPFLERIDTARRAIFRRICMASQHYTAIETCVQLPIKLQTFTDASQLNLRSSVNHLPKFDSVTPFGDTLLLRMI